MTMTLDSTFDAAASGAPTEDVKAQPLKRKRWPRVHLIYFALALFDIIAVGGGLYLSYHQRLLFEESVAVNDEWSRRFVSIWQLTSLASKASEPGNSVFQSKDATAERKRLDAAADEFDQAVEKVKAEIIANTSGTLASQPVRTLTYVQQAMAIMVGHGKRTLTEFEKGEIERATQSMVMMDRSAIVLRDKLNDSITAIRQIQSSYAAGFSGKVEALKWYETVIGGAILVMVACVALYGHLVGRFMTRKYHELEAAHDDAVASEARAVGYANELSQANGQMTRLNSDLERSLARLRDTQDELVRKGRLSQLGQLTATVAHELRNPLGAVRTSIYLLDRKVKGKVVGIEPQIERINNGVRRCDDIISQLLDFARTKQLQYETLALDDWVAKIVDEEAQNLPVAVGIEVHLGAGDTAVAFDPARMSRVLINLLSNAAEAMVGKGDDPSKFTTRDPRIIIRTAVTARGAGICVADNGPGFDDEMKQKILEPLFTTKSFGTGLGLPAVQKILEQHGGGLDVDSRPGEGACFTAWWPLAVPMQEVA